MRFPFTLGPITRVALGLISLVVSLVMLSDLVLGLLPQPAEAALKTRQRVIENVAAQVTVFVTSSDTANTAKSLQQALAQNPDMLSLALRTADGVVIAQRGDHARHWPAREDARTRWNHVFVQLHAKGKPWGRLEAAFTPAEPRGLVAWLKQPAVLFYILLLAGGFALCYFYLRRVMQYLDPSSAVPERVRAAFDTLGDGVLVLDPQGRILLANRSFRDMHPDAKGELQGRSVAQLQWLPRQDTGAVGGMPWERVLRGEPAGADTRVTILRPEGAPMEAIVRCSPVNDAGGRVRGCIATFHDVTDVHAANDRLRKTLTDLERTREQINLQNEELRRLAMRDPMTGCYNRRAFFDSAGTLVSEAMGGGDANLCCIMTDIDHFKGFNDLYGHSVGDQVIQIVAKNLTNSIRANDLLCRYGGEEFCILLPNTSLADACAVAERARSAIETKASDGIRDVKVRKITSSFGVACLSDGAAGLQELIDQADQALYASKEAGRNRVTVWTRETHPV
jgi:diguanylate cyclase (GGDEF)-like protein/PAS domain S-box-containing protein